jgi:cytochrome c oxidase accessory protein FixG
MNTRERPTLDRLYMIRTDGSRRKLHPADVRGRFIRARRIGFAVLGLVALLLPSVQVGGHPAVQLHVAARRFYLFGSVWNATDAWMAVFVLLSVAFALLFVTTWKGRAWCGWACPQTVFLEGIYRPIERLIEGSSEQRLRLERGPSTLGKVVRRAAKHGLFVTMSIFIAHSVVAYFVSIPSLARMIAEGPRAHFEAFAWATAVTAVVYFNFAWFREQLCIVLCPYGRLQSVLTVRDSTVVGYDQTRGEPRGKTGTQGAGDCVDCGRCIAVCPTGIDIRNGLQLECLACAQCIDACDEIMDKLQRPRGLVRYDSQRRFAGEAPPPRVRTRLVAYGTLLGLAIAGATVSARGRALLESRLLRTRGAPWVIEPGDDGVERVRNQFELHLTNKRPERTEVTVSPRLPEGARLILPRPTVTLDPLESVRLPLFVSVPSDRAQGFDLEVEVTGGDARTVAHARFVAPQSR